MSNLIKISNQDGKQLVNAKELYLGLGLNKSQWSRWYPTNIEKNEFFKENIDWVGVRHNVEGNETMDFAITLEFAKHIAMMARTEKSHEYRNYFLKVEKAFKEQKQLSPLEQLRLQYEVIEEQQEKLEEHDKEINNIKEKIESLEVSPFQKRQLMKARNKRVMELIGGKKSQAYQDASFRSKVYAELSRQYNNYFEISGYEYTPKNKFEEAKDVIEIYSLSTELAMELRKINSQVRF
ncbi:phage antirepressor Ant [Clostridium tetani]|uniref:ORF6C domain-containing protein n=1 Tax=Clostridium tetani TaxID=1513 RepID=UPI00100B8B73|nr:ORF6C domain-containing protein [Clostridium tetani]RXM75329.1 phage antirepressor Ant [Clostridium tetani]RYU98643.1 phage antirepressor Ant [Clostridium tetani]